MKRLLMIGLAVLATSAMASQGVVDFEELTLEANSFGPVLTGTPQYIPVSADFTSGGVTFPHTYTNHVIYEAWDGFVYSNRVDVTTAGHVNQYSAFAGGGVYGSGNYAIGYIASEWEPPFNIIPIRLTLNTPGELVEAYFTNTTYVALDMLHGSTFSAPFTQNDYFKLSITGLNANGTETGTVEFLLADGTAIVDQWVRVDLSELGVVSQIEFSIISSNPDTPTYFAMDNLTYVIPEPTTLFLLGVGGAITAMRRKRK